MATAQVDMPTSEASGSASPWLGTLAFAKKRQFAWKTALLAFVTVGLGLVVAIKSAFAAQLYLGLLIVVHVVGLAVFALRVERADIAPSRFGLFWRLVGLLTMVALLGMIRLDPDSGLFWPSLGAIWGLHTAGLAMLHLRARDGASCPFVPRAWRTGSPPGQGRA